MRRDIVSVEVAKLARKAGYDEASSYFYLIDNEGEPNQFDPGYSHTNETIRFITSINIECIAPTYERLRNWISEKLHKEFYAAYDYECSKWYAVVEDHILFGQYDTRYKAYELALVYLLNHYINVTCQNNK